jgi:hypothetical protein
MDNNETYTYYDDKLAESGAIYKTCCICVIAILLILALFILCGCRSVKSAEKEKTEIGDSVRIEYKEKIVKVPVTVYVEVPVESHINMTNDSSHLETGFAVSDAMMIWIDGVPFLRHTLANKAQTIGKNDSVPVTEKEKVVWRTRRVTYTKKEILEKENTWWEKMKIRYGEVSFVLNIFFMLSIIVILRRRK